MDERDIIERAKAWLAAGYGGEVQGGIIRDLLAALSTAQAELAKAREDFALLRAGRDANETYLLAELAEARKVIEPFADAYIAGGEGTFYPEDALIKARDTISHEHLRRASAFAHVRAPGASMTAPYPTKGEIEALIDLVWDALDLVPSGAAARAQPGRDALCRLADALALTRVDKSINASQGLGTTVSSALETAAVHDYVRQLTVYACSKYGNPDWRPLADTMGLLTQLDNALTGLSLSSAKQNEGDRSRDELNTSSKPVKTPPDTEHDGGEVLSRWLPIETAPKDGEPILATSAEYAYTLQRCAVVWWESDVEDGCEVGWFGQQDEDDEPRRTWLTHWMPLPPPPRTGGE